MFFLYITNSSKYYSLCSFTYRFFFFYKFTMYVEYFVHHKIYERVQNDHDYHLAQSYSTPLRAHLL